MSRWPDLLVWLIVAAAVAAMLFPLWWFCPCR